MLSSAMAPDCSLMLLLALLVSAQSVLACAPAWGSCNPHRVPPPHRVHVHITERAPHQLPSQCCCVVPLASLRGAPPPHPAQRSTDARRFQPRNLQALDAAEPAVHHPDVPDPDTAILCLPAFVVAGVQKSGTTALLGILTHHPQYAPTAKKEVHFFDNLMLPKDVVSAKDADRFLKVLPAYLDEPARAKYDAMLASDPESPDTKASPNMPRRLLRTSDLGSFITGEATPSYVLKLQAIRYIKKLLPEARIVVILRNPIDRAYSEYQMLVSTQMKLGNQDPPASLVAVGILLLSTRYGVSACSSISKTRTLCDH
eukprot:m.640987 g.640987  ORF g.640987 m.640987 type:complete len:314 (+) comp58344_c2_seq15:1588-2529(+)